MLLVFQDVEDSMAEQGVEMEIITAHYMAFRLALRLSLSIRL